MSAPLDRSVDFSPRVLAVLPSRVGENPRYLEDAMAQNDLSPPPHDELFTPLLISPHVRIERIVSHGHASPPGFWYDQAENEWVMVLSGAARLLIEGAESAIELGPGDHVNLPAHQRHRVEWTTPGEPTVWLAVFYKEDAGV